MIETNKIYQGDCLEVLKTFPDRSIDCCITSPPYFGLRDYGTANWEGGDKDCDHIEPQGGNNPETSGKQLTSAGTRLIQYKSFCKKCDAVRTDSQIGLEETPEMYVAKMVEVFTEVKRVLKDEGTLWLNLADTYNGGGGGNRNGIDNTTWNNAATERKRSEKIGTEKLRGLVDGLKPKDLIGIPWMVAFALRGIGYYLRQDIIWSKPNPMPESVTDRCTKAHEYIFLMSKSAKYYYDADAIKEPSVSVEYDDSEQKVLRTKGGGGGFGSLNGKNNCVQYSHSNETGKAWIPSEMRNKRSVWTVTTRAYSAAHFATFPERLITDMIKAGCLEGGIILDPFMGAGTTGLVSRKLNRNYIGIELNQEYITIAEKRIREEIGLFQ